MAVTIALKFAGKNRLRYLLTATDNSSANITTTGAATPDVQTDLASNTLPGASILMAIAKTITAGYGKLAAGALTQAQARALWQSDDAASVVGAGVPTAMCVLTPRSGSQEWTIDANVTGGNPIITAASTVNAAATAYLDIYIPGGIGS